ncbi:hypothetical protein LXL04_032812 [Taraxacum kok-saghyz]
MSENERSGLVKDSFASLAKLVADGFIGSNVVAACCMADHPLFPGESGVDQLVGFGNTHKSGVKCMNPNYTEFRFPQIKPHPWHKKRLPPEAVDLVCRFFQYSPNFTLKKFIRNLSFIVEKLEACVHPFFDELRDPAPVPFLQSLILNPKILQNRRIKENGYGMSTCADVEAE